MLKLMLKAVIAGLFNNLLMTKKGATVLNGHVTLFDVKPHQTTTLIDIGDGYQYKIVINRFAPDE